ncbi:hypothetical protein [Dietzia massiliensis]|nr:hypothetical protein [Dietzia massiliensis]
MTPRRVPTLLASVLTAVALVAAGCSSDAATELAAAEAATTTTA